MKRDWLQPFTANFEDYLRDESKMKGQADSISFPKTGAEVADIIRYMANNSISVTVQGGKTGICGGAVPLSGHILNLSSLNKIRGFRQVGDEYFIRVEAGVRLLDLQKQLEQRAFDTHEWDEKSLAALAAFKERKGYFWPPAPTEGSATIGGILAVNAQGIGGYLYGDTRKYVEELYLVDGWGKESTLSRGESQLFENGIVFAEQESPDEIRRVAPLPPEADDIDFFLGSEGMYGVIVEATLRLRMRPQEIWGIGFFFREQESLCRFAERVIGDDYQERSAAIAVVEYIDQVTLTYIQDLKKIAAKLQSLPAIDEFCDGMIYIEIHGEQEVDIEVIAENLLCISEECGCDESHTWAVSGSGEIEKMRDFRHAAPESVNIAMEPANRADSRIVKLACDISMPGNRFGEVITNYQRTAQAEGLDIAIFGHVRNNHVQVNVLPRNYEEYVKGNNMIEKWAISALEKGGAVFAENGVGKVKKELFQSITEKESLGQLRKVKHALDPGNILNPGNWFAE